METKFIHFAGIDVSKAKFDVCIIIGGEKSELYSENFEQSKKGFNEFKKWLTRLTGKQKQYTLVCIENTGLYDDALLYFLDDLGYAICLENAALIKTSIRDRRAKNDQLDARHIALYALRHQIELELWQRPRSVIEKIKQLLRHRDCLVEGLKRIRQAEKELDTFNWAKVKQTRNYDSGIKGLQKDITKIEEDIWNLVKMTRHYCLCLAYWSVSRPLVRLQHIILFAIQMNFGG